MTKSVIFENLRFNENLDFFIINYAQSIGAIDKLPGLLNFEQP